MPQFDHAASFFHQTQHERKELHFNITESPHNAQKRTTMRYICDGK
jgi:hypothetical protein